MQAQRVAPPDLMCKDKFLIQSTVVPFGTAEEDITSDMVRICQCNDCSICFYDVLLFFIQFSKESGKHIEDKKLKVFLTSPPYSPVLAAINGELKQDSSHETSSPRDRAWSGVENIPPPKRVSAFFML